VFAKVGAVCCAWISGASQPIGLHIWRPTQQTTQRCVIDLSIIGRSLRLARLEQESTPRQRLKRLAAAEFAVSVEETTHSAEANIDTITASVGAPIGELGSGNIGDGCSHVHAPLLCNLGTRHFSIRSQQHHRSRSTIAQLFRKIVNVFISMPLVCP
jgi:hypothetical protein